MPSICNTFVTYNEGQRICRWWRPKTVGVPPVGMGVLSNDGVCTLVLADEENTSLFPSLTFTKTAMIGTHFYVATLKMTDDDDIAKTTKALYWTGTRFFLNENIGRLQYEPHPYIVIHAEAKLHSGFWYVVHMERPAYFAYVCQTYPELTKKCLNTLRFEEETEMHYSVESVPCWPFKQDVLELAEARKSETLRLLVERFS